jgi:predicted O-methyltransferase YrrM
VIDRKEARATDARRLRETFVASSAAWPGGAYPWRYPEDAVTPAAAGLCDTITRYRGELLELSADMAEWARRFDARGMRRQLADVEAELLYVLVRETAPSRVVEISPAEGWSTNHLLAALTRNGRGELHSFEIAADVGGEPIETVLRSNLHPSVDQDRLTLHVGDAQVEAASAIDGPIDLLFLDSNHEAWFAEWYLADIVPRTHGPCFVHDIVHADGTPKREQYLDGETYAVLEWLEREAVSAIPVAGLEPGLAGVRRDFRTRSSIGSTGIVFWSDGAEVSPATRPRAALRAADESLAAGAHDRAQALLAEVRSAANGAPHVALQLAERYRRAGLASDARTTIEQLLRAPTTSPTWLYIAGRYALSMALPGAALTGYGRAARNPSTPPWIRRRLRRPLLRAASRLHRRT